MTCHYKHGRRYDQCTSMLEPLDGCNFDRVTLTYTNHIDLHKSHFLCRSVSMECSCSSLLVRP